MEKYGSVLHVDAKVILAILRGATYKVSKLGIAVIRTFPSADRPRQMAQNRPNLRKKGVVGNTPNRSNR